MRYMDYEEFSKEYKKFEDWDEWTGQEDSEVVNELLWGDKGMHLRPVKIGHYKPEDRVNHPSHYTSGRTEAIEIIEDAIAVAPTPKEGFLQGQALKYILRLWLKNDPLEDAKKAQWYLKRLINSLE